MGRLEFRIDSKQTQQWQIVVPRLQQYVQLTCTGSRSEISAVQIFFDESIDCEIWSKLARPARRMPYVQCVSHEEKRRMPLVQLQRLSQLEALPLELLDMILGRSELSKRDRIVLALSSDVLWSHLLHHISRKCGVVAAPWAGHELACTGRYITDLPKALEKDNLFYSSVSSHPRGLLELFGEMCTAAAINWAAIGQYEAAPEDTEVAWRAALDQQASLVRSSVEYDRLFRLKVAVLETLADRWRPLSKASQDPWVLRNLTTKQFVRCRPTRSGEGLCIGYVDHEGTRAHPLRLDMLLLMCICWSTAWPGDKPSGLHTMKGVWAGHGFDIVEQEEMDIADDTWEDVTDEKVAEAVEVRDSMLDARQ